MCGACGLAAPVISDPFLTQQPVACQAHLSMEFSRQEYWSGLPFSTPGDLLKPGVKPVSLAFPALAGKFFTTEQPGKPTVSIYLIKRKMPLVAVSKVQSKKK